MSVEELIRQYLPAVKIMQLATSQNDKPWVCNLHYVSDENLNIYWLSKPETRHSEDIKQNPQTAINVMVHQDAPGEDYIIGLSLEGTSSLLDKDQIVDTADKYSGKLGTSEKFMATVKDGSNPHMFYKFIPTNIVLFDTKNFKGNPRQEWRVKT